MDESSPAKSFPVDRRGFLKLSATTLAALSLIAGALNGPNPPTSIPFKPGVLTPAEVIILSKLAEVVLPTEPPYPSVQETRLVERVDRELQFHTLAFVGDVKAALLLIEFGGWLHGTPGRFSHWERSRQEVRVEQLAHSWLEVEKVAFGALRGLLLFLYYTDEHTWAHIHYEGPLWPVRKLPEASNVVES